MPDSFPQMYKVALRSFAISAVHLHPLRIKVFLCHSHRIRIINLEATRALALMPTLASHASTQREDSRHQQFLMQAEECLQISLRTVYPYILTPAERSGSLAPSGAFLSSLCLCGKGLQQGT
jgi:hypothetical protein